ncbi:MAG: hypothetical protein SGBAC_012101 [Bacillariaceae sp.]
MSTPWNRAVWLGLSVVSVAAVSYKLYKNRRSARTDGKDAASSPGPSTSASNEEKVNELVLQRFQACSEYMKNRITKLAPSTQLELYAWYKQATEGSLDPSKIKAPRSYDRVGTSKYNAWKKLEGMSKSSAMQLYIDKAMLVEFTASMQNDDNDNGDDGDGDADEMEDAIMDFGGMDMKPSTLNYDDDDENDNAAKAAKEYPLHEAAMSGNLEELKNLLQQSTSDGSDGENAASGLDPNGQDSSGQTALHLCADRGNLDCLDLLLSSSMQTTSGAGVEVDIGDQDGITPLQTAVISGHVKICERLLEAGADPDKPDNDGDTPRSSAEDDADMLALLEKYPAK